MSFFNTLRTWVTGVDIEATAKQDALTEAQIADQNKKLVDRNIWDPGVYDQYLKNAAPSASSTYEDQMAKAFTEGWGQGYDRVTGGIKSAINAPFQFAFAAIPLWVWAALVLWILWELGWLKKWFVAK